MFFVQIADLAHVIYDHGAHTHQIVLVMAVDCVCLFKLVLTNNLCPKPLYGRSPVISISLILNFHEVKTRTYLFIPMYALGLPFQHNLYSCLCGIECIARVRFTPLALYFISPAEALYIYISSTAVTLASILATRRKIAHANAPLQTSCLLCLFDVSIPSNHL